MAYPQYEFRALGVNRPNDYSQQASQAMGQASQSYASMDKKKPKQEDGSWVGDAAFMYAVGKETGLIDDVKNAGKVYIPQLSEFLGGGSKGSAAAMSPQTEMGNAMRASAQDPTKFDPGQMSPGAAPGAEFSAASAPKQPLSPTAARAGSDPLATTQGMLAGEGANNAAQSVAQQTVTDQAARAGVQAGVAGAGEAVGATLGGAAGAGVGTLALSLIHI
jgi:hypothetical protein